MAYKEDSPCGILKEIKSSVEMAEMIPELLSIPSDTTMTTITKKRKQKKFYEKIIVKIVFDKK